VHDNKKTFSLYRKSGLTPLYHSLPDHKAKQADFSFFNIAARFFLIPYVVLPLPSPIAYLLSFHVLLKYEKLW